MKAPLNLALLSRVLSQLWAMREQSLVSLTQALLAGENLRPKTDTSFNVPHYDEATGRYQNKRYPTQKGYTATNYESLMASLRGNLPEVGDGISVVMLWGALGRGWTESDRYWLDPVESDELTAAVAATEPGSTVVLWFRSPGGIVTGIPEASEALRTLGETRRIVSFTDDLCASAAYWLAAQTSRIVATPTADVGSIGVYLAYYDYCGYLEKMGVKLELFKAGSLKGTGVVGNPLDDEARAHLQAGVVESYKLFTREVTAQREIASEHMQGQTLSGKAAKSANLVDSFRSSASEFFAALGKGRV